MTTWFQFASPEGVVRVAAVARPTGTHGAVVSRLTVGVRSAGIVEARYAIAPDERVSVVALSALANGIRSPALVGALGVDAAR